MSVVGLAATLPGWAAVAWWDWRDREVPVAVLLPLMGAGIVVHAADGFSQADVVVALGILAVGGAAMRLRLWPAGDVFGALTLGVAGGTLGLWALVFGALAGVPLALAHHDDPDGVPYLVALAIGAVAVTATAGLLPYLA